MGLVDRSRRSAPLVALVCLLAVLVASPTPAHGQRAAEPAAAGRAAKPMVLAISVDGLNPRAINRLGQERAPNLWRLAHRGASTLNARTSYELTITLPNHTGMVTSRRVDKDRGGHGVVWNDERLDPNTVQEAAGHPVRSIFSLADRNGLRTGLFAGKAKFSLFDRSWPGDIDRVHTGGESDQLMREVRSWVTSKPRPDFTFWHIALPDAAGHADGWMSPEYLDAVVATDQQIGSVLTAIRNRPALRDRVTTIVTADHGGTPGTTAHSDVTVRENYRVPFLVWGAQVADRSLYALNPTYRNPGTGRPAYAARRQPIRNADLGNLAASLLGLGPIPGSGVGEDQTLVVR